MVNMKRLNEIATSYNCNVRYEMYNHGGKYWYADYTIALGLRLSNRNYIYFLTALSKYSGIPLRHINMIDRRVLIFLHELGHHMNRHLRQKNRRCSQKDYRLLPNEYAADVWASNYIREHYSELLCIC